MKLKINGEIQTVDDHIRTVEQLLDARNIGLKCVAVELNGVILDPAQFVTTGLSEQDVLEIVSFVGGG